MEFWWIAPGLAVLAVGLALRLIYIALAIARREHLNLGLFALRLRQIGIGLTLLGTGASFFFPALNNGPDVGLLIVGGLVAGMGGLYFISASDPMFRRGAPWIAPRRWRHRKPTVNPDEIGDGSLKGE